MSEDSTGSLGKIIQIDESQIQAQLTRVVRGTVEETLNGLLDAEAERLVNAGRLRPRRGSARLPGGALRAAVAYRRGGGTAQGGEAQGPGV